MATNFPVERTEQQLASGGSGRLNLDVGSGGREIAAADRTIAAGIQAWTNQLDANKAEAYNIQVETELSDAMLATGEDRVTFSIELNGNLDPTTYEKKNEEFIARAQGRTKTMFRTTEGARKYNLWVNGRISIWNNATEEARQKMIDRNYEATLLGLQQTAIETGNMAPYIGAIAKAVKMGQVTDAEAKLLIKNTQHAAEINAAMNEARDNPRGMMRDINEIGKGDSLPKFPTIKLASDIQRIRNAATTAMNDKQVDTVDKIYGQLNRAIDGNNPEQIERAYQSAYEIIDANTGPNGLFDEKEALALRDIIHNRETALAQKRADPFEQTDNGMLLDFQKRIRAGVNVPTTSEIYSKVGAAKLKAGLWKGGISIDDKNDLFKRLDTVTGQPEKPVITDARSLMRQKIGDVGPLGILTLAGKQVDAFTEAQITLNRAIRTAEQEGKPLTDDEILIQSMKIAGRIKHLLMEGEDMPILEGKPPFEQTMATVTGLDEIWGELDAEERQTAVKALSQGKTAKQIIDFFNKQK
jgi:hypothetical protein